MKTVLKTSFYTFGILSLLLATVNIHAQVTIGSGLAPNKGALLDLKEHEADENNVTATKGILLPRVYLSYPTSLMGIDGVKSPGNDPQDMIDYIGLIVYNTSDKKNLSSGVHIWDGQKWQNLMGEKGSGNGEGEDDDKTSFDPKTGLLTDHEGNRYFTGDFGTAGRWMTQNLRTHSYWDSNVTMSMHNDSDHNNSATDRQYCFPGGWKPGNENEEAPDFIREYGLLYNYAAASNVKRNLTDEEAKIHDRIQGVCPKGWHLPSDLEWTQLENEILTNTHLYSTTTDLGGSIIPKGQGSRGNHSQAIRAHETEHGINSDGTSFLAEDGGFSAIPVGYAFSSVPQDFSIGAYFWTASSGGALTEWSRSTRLGDPGVSKLGGITEHLLSVRCKMDNTGDPVIEPITEPVVDTKENSKKEE